MVCDYYYVPTLDTFSDSVMMAVPKLEIGPTVVLQTRHQLMSVGERNNNEIRGDAVKEIFLVPSPPGAAIDDEALLKRVISEFDGTTVLCRVCGDKASGFHYGVHSCEGCKGFFRRSIQQKIQYRPCTKNQQCSILRINRNRCQYCRLKKCIAVGMSRDAVRFGRVPKREKAKILAAMQSVAWRSQEKAVDAALAMEDNSMLTAVVGAHRDTCPFTRDRLPTFLMRAHEQAHVHPNTNAPNGHMACPLNPVGVTGDPYCKGEGESVMLQDFSQRFSPAIRGVVEFAKRLPGFPMLVQEDQVTLLKAGVFEVLLLRLAGLFDSQTNTMVSLNGMVVRRESIGNAANGANGAMFGNARFLMDSMFDFADRLNALQLSDAELALFSAVVVVSPDRPGLRNPELVERMWSKMTTLLKQVIRRRQRTHKPDGSEEPISEEQAQQMYDELVKKIPDLRTLNTLHSEKLLAFKMTEQQVKHEKEVEETEYRCPNFVPQRAKWHHEEHQVIGSSNSSTSSGHCSGSSGCASPRSPHSLMSEEGVKSPGGSLCSNESVCSADCHSVSTVASMGRCPVPRPSEEHRVLPQYHGMTTALGMCMQAASSTHEHADIYAPRKLDSPTDSGIESGCEAARLCGKLSPSRPTSVCSSPREDLAGESSPEDMPVLKRALQAPPLINTNLLMDEAYRPHKKFRAMRREQDGETASSTSSSSPGPSCSPLRRALTPPESEQRVHSTLARSLMEAPKMTAEQMKQTDMLTSLIMRGEVPEAYCPYNGAGPSSAVEPADSSVYSTRTPYGYATMAATRVVSTLSTLPTAVPSTSYYPPSPIQPPVQLHPRLSPPSPACPDSPSDALTSRLYREEPMELTREEPMKMEFAQEAQDVVAPLNLSKKIMAIPREPTSSRMHVKLEA